MKPEHRECLAPDGSLVAYATIGSGPPVVFTGWWVSHLDLDWRNPAFRAFFETLAQHHLVVRYDRPGVGMSVRERTDYSLAAEVSYALAVMDDLRLDRAALFGASCGGPAAVIIATEQPERVTHLVLYGSYAAGQEISTPDVQAALGGLVEASWGLASQTLTQVFLPHTDPTIAGALSSDQRASANAEVAARLLQLTFDLDVSDRVGDVAIPTLVMHRTDDVAVPARLGRALAEGIPGAELCLLDGDSHVPWESPSDDVLRTVETFLTGSEPTPVVRRLAAVVATRIHDGAVLQARSGTRRGSGQLTTVGSRLRACVDRAGGRLIEESSEALLVSFVSAQGAVDLARMIGQIGRDLGVTFSVGIHAGQVAEAGGTMTGPALETAAKLEADAGPDEVLASEAFVTILDDPSVDFVASGTLDDGDTGITCHRLSPPHLSRTPSAQPSGGRVPRTREPSTKAELERSGNVWNVRFGAKSSQLKHSKGLGDLATLLARPFDPVHVHDLAAEHGADRTQLGADAMLDDEALSAYRSRLRMLDDALADAEADNDLGRAESLQIERDAILDELSRATGLGGRSRRLSDETERARKAVTARLRAALSRIEAADPALGEHLAASVSTGSWCRYAPTQPCEWRVDPNP